MIELEEREVNGIIEFAEGILRFIAYAQGRAEHFYARRDEFKIIQFPTQRKDNGYSGENEVSKPLKDEVKEMLVELDIKGSLRERADGLLEFRNTKFGSVYGRTKEEIKRKLTKKLQELHDRSRGAKPQKSKSPLLSEFFETEYLPYKKSKNRAENTIGGYLTNMKFISESNFDKSLTKYTSSEIEKFLLSVPKTRKRQILQGFLNNVFKRALAQAIIKSNPCAPLEKMEHDGEEGTALEFCEQREFFDKLKKLDIKIERKLYLIFIYLTGCRRNEALDLTESDVDFERKVIHVCGTKTDGSDRYIPLYPLVEKLLKSLEPKEGRYFPFSEWAAQTSMKKCSKEHRLHDLRHTYGTIQICAEKVDVKTVSLLLGHSNIETTLKIYTHPEQLDRAIFLRGDIPDAEKVAIWHNQYADVLKQIENLLNTHDLPKNCIKKAPHLD